MRLLLQVNNNVTIEQVFVYEQFSYMYLLLAYYLPVHFEWVHT